MPAGPWRSRLNRASLPGVATIFACSRSSDVSRLFGEAANAAPEEMHAQFPGIAFRKAIAMRHRLIHGYNRINLSIVEATVQDDLPGLIVSLERALGSTLPGD